MVALRIGRLPHYTFRMTIVLKVSIRGIARQKGVLLRPRFTNIALVRRTAPQLVERLTYLLILIGHAQPWTSPIVQDDGCRLYAS